MIKDRRPGAGNTSAGAGDRASRLGAALRANLQRRKARARALAEDETAGDPPDNDKPRNPAAED